MDSRSESAADGSFKKPEKESQEKNFTFDDDIKTVSVFDYISQDVFVDDTSGQLGDVFNQDLKSTRTRSTSDFDESIHIECN